MWPMTGYAGAPAWEAKRALRARFRTERRERAAGRDREADAAWIAEAGLRIVTAEEVGPGDWVSAYERTWTERFEALDSVLEELKDKEQGDGDGDA